MFVLSIEDTHRLIAETLERCDTSPANAASVAKALIAAECAGQAGHGMRRLPSYAAQASSGKVDGYARVVCEQVAPAALKIDAAHGFAYPALDAMHARLPEMAKTNGIAVAGIHRSHHCGVAGVIVEQLADAGLVALMFANTPAAMAPAGGSKAIYGTNPIAFAAPRGDAGPIVVDVSLSKVARGKIMAAKQSGKPIPEGIALGPDGEPTTDADAALAGTMLPIGDAKGTALALMVELLAAGVTGASYAADASSFLSADGPPPGTGQLVIAIDPTKFGGEAIIHHINALACQIENQDGARVPGARRREIAQKVRENGIEIDDDLLKAIQSVGVNS
ncbi:Ldh family oxidoreductase [Pseudahrensia aquimaris]|uniref:Ldh family oxidoreductase n=1 Tax=Pseudahrensia aquimaris TaxID=744461 RepID=A0ABW3FI45_9HYPH